MIGGVNNLYVVAGTVGAARSRGVALRRGAGARALAPRVPRRAAAAPGPPPPPPVNAHTPTPHRYTALHVAIITNVLEMFGQIWFPKVQLVTILSLAEKTQRKVHSSEVM